MADFFFILKTNLIPFGVKISSVMAKSTCSFMVGIYKVLDLMLDPFRSAQRTALPQRPMAVQLDGQWSRSCGSCTNSCFN